MSGIIHVYSRKMKLTLYFSRKSTSQSLTSVY